jgi:twitching motility protein PilT
LPSQKLLFVFSGSRSWGDGRQGRNRGGRLEGSVGAFKMIELKELLKIATERKASDVHIKAGAAPYFRIEGELAPYEAAQIVSREETVDLARRLLNTRQREILAKKSEIDVSFGVEGIGRFRLAIFQQRGSVSMVLRLIVKEDRQMEDLHLPPILREIAEATRGMILVTGISGAGKSTTLAAMLQHINSTRRCHILTIEDPIEFLFEDDKALITQREIASDTIDFASALRAALRQDPDVIMVGEMRDLETVTTAMQAAETGHLVMSTLHTGDSVDTIRRVISMFPPTLQQDIRARFASVLRAIISMRLIKSSVTGQRIPAVEILRNTELIQSLLVQQERTKEILHALEKGHSQYGMQTFDQSILRHFQDGLITAEDALKNATSPEDMRLKMEGIVSSSEAV